MNNLAWEILFEKMVERETKEFESMNPKGFEYIYFGEIDDPEEMYNFFATRKDVESTNGKTNWLLRSDGKFITCSDCMLELFENNTQITDIFFPFMNERNNVYESLSMEDQIAFRMKLQDISFKKAKEIVCEELEIPPYKYEFTFEVKLKLFNTLSKEMEDISFKRFISEDSFDEALVLIKKSNPKKGDIQSQGKKYSEEDNIELKKTGCFFYNDIGKPYQKIVQDISFELINQKEL